MIDQVIFLQEGYIMEFIDYPHRRDVVDFFQGPCVVIPMSPLNNLMVLEEASVMEFDTKKAFSMMSKIEKARFYKEFEQQYFERNDKYFAELKTKTPAERYLMLLNTVRPSLIILITQLIVI